MFFKNKKKNRNKVSNLVETTSTNTILSPKGYDYGSLSFFSDYRRRKITYDEFIHMTANVFFTGAIGYMTFLREFDKKKNDAYNAEKEIINLSTDISEKNITSYYALIKLMRISIDVMIFSNGNAKLLFCNHAIDLSRMRSYLDENDYRKIASVISDAAKNKCDKDDILDWEKLRNPEEAYEQITDDEFDLFMQRLVLCRELKDAGKQDFDAYNQQIDANGDCLDGDVIGKLVRSYEKYADIADQIKSGAYRNADGKLVKIPKEMQGMANIIERYADIANS